MNTSKFRILILGSLFFIVFVLLFAFVKTPTPSNAGETVLDLQAPLFVTEARAESSKIGEYLDDEAGISAWFKSSFAINLDDVRGAFPTIEDETEDYIIGSIPVPNYNEKEDAHVYVHTDGWVLAYYLNQEPVSKAIDINFYRTNRVITTKLQAVLEAIASAAGVPFPGASIYDFRYPNATNMMVVAEVWGDGDSSFLIELPSSYGYFERGWSLQFTGQGTTLAYFKVDGVEIGGNCSYCYGTITASQLSVDTSHTISVRAYGALVLIYRVP